MTKKKDVFNGRSLLGRPVEVSSEESDHSLSLKNLSFSIENIQPQNISNSIMNLNSFLEQNDRLKESDLIIDDDCSDHGGALIIKCESPHNDHNDLSALMPDMSVIQPEERDIT